MPVFSGGFTYLETGWSGRSAIFVRFQSGRTSHVHQLYSGRRMIGRTRSPLDRKVIGQYPADASPAPLTILAVPPNDADTDFGSYLPNWPWNRYRLTWTASGYPADTDRFEIASGTTPGGAVDWNTILGEVPFHGDGTYEFDLPSISETGTWNYGVRSRDNAQPDGNAGTAATLAVNAAVMPADVQFVNDQRFTLSVANSQATVGFTYP